MDKNAKPVWLYTTDSVPNHRIKHAMSVVYTYEPRAVSHTNPHGALEALSDLVRALGADCAVGVRIEAVGVPDLASRFLAYGTPVLVELES